MKIFKFVLVLMSSLMFGQTYRLIYELKYKTDSLKDHYSSQNMVLDISEHETKFYYEKLLKFDSLSRKGINISFSMPLQQILKKAKGGKMYSNYYSVDGQYFQYNTDWFSVQIYYVHAFFHCLPAGVECSTIRFVVIKCYHAT